MARKDADWDDFSSDSDEISNRLSNCTLQRGPKVDLSKADMVELLSNLEGELQARDVTIAALQAERAKQFLYQAKYGRFRLVDPLHALQRDSELCDDISFDEAAVKAMYDDQLIQLENLISSQHTSQQQMREQLSALDKQYHKTCRDLEDVKLKHSRDMEQCDNVTYMLEKERERLKQEVDHEKGQTRKLEKELKKSADSIEESNRICEKHKQVAVMLIKERQALVKKILQLRQMCATLSSELTAERAKALDLEQNVRGSCLDKEHEQMLARLAIVEEQNEELSNELERLRSETSNTSFNSTIDKRRATDMTALGVRKSGTDMTASVPVRQSPHTYISERTVCPTSPIATQTKSTAAARPLVESSGSRHSSVSGGNTALSPRGVTYSGRLGHQPTSSQHSAVQTQGHGTSIILPESSNEFTVTTIRTSGIPQKTSHVDRRIPPHGPQTFASEVAPQSIDYTNMVYQHGNTAPRGGNNAAIRGRPTVSSVLLNSDSSGITNSISHARPGSTVSTTGNRLSGNIASLRDLSPAENSKTFSHIW